MAQPPRAEPCFKNQIQPDTRVPGFQVWGKSLSIGSMALNLLLLEQKPAVMSVPQFPHPGSGSSQYTHLLDSGADCVYSHMPEVCFRKALQPSAASWMCRVHW